MQAQHGEMEFTSKKDQTITSCQRKIRVAAGQEVLLTSGGGYIRIRGGRIEVHCPGTISIKGANHQWSGPASMNVPLPGIGESKPVLQLNYHYDDLEPLAGAPYKVVFANGDVRQGFLDKA